MIKAAFTTLSLCVMSSQVLGDTHHGSPLVANCPTAFHNIELHDEAKLCQIFDDGGPATLTYHVQQAPTVAILFYSQNNGMTVHSTVSERTLLLSADGKQRVVVSPDGQGSQIDILVISPTS